MIYDTIDDLRSQLGSSKTPEKVRRYAAKMLHAVPVVPEINREEFILSRCKGKNVLEFGASGKMSEAVQQVSSDYLGVDRTAADRGVVAFDLDDISMSDVPGRSDVDVVLCGEVLEHLTNPGWFLERLRHKCRSASFLFTVPNAFSSAGARHLLRGNENVNIDHVCWYSPRTIRTLLERYAFEIREFYYYNGAGPTSEGLIVVAS